MLADQVEIFPELCFDRINVASMNSQRILNRSTRSEIQISTHLIVRKKSNREIVLMIIVIKKFFIYVKIRIQSLSNLHIMPYYVNNKIRLIMCAKKSLERRKLDNIQLCC